jgi:hypothetical protein
MALGVYLKNALLNYVFNHTAYTQPTVYVALSTIDPGVSGATLTEPTDAAYLRVATTTSTWNTSIVGSTSNALAISFPPSTTSWGTISYGALMDATKAAGGNFLARITITPPVTVGSANVANFAEGTLVIT